MAFRKEKALITELSVTHYRRSEPQRGRACCLDVLRYLMTDSDAPPAETAK